MQTIGGGYLHATHICKMYRLSMHSFVQNFELMLDAEFCRDFLFLAAIYITAFSIFLI